MKFGLVIIISFSGLSLYAQVKLGLKAGVLVSNNKAAYTNSNKGYSNDPKMGGLVGLAAHLPLTQNVSFQSGIEFVVKGSKQRRIGSGFYGDYDYTHRKPLLYLDVPLNIVYAAKAGNGKWIIGGGPVIGIFLNNGYREFPLKQTDIGVNVVTGYEWPIKFFVNLNHARGLKNLSSSKLLVSDYKNYYSGFSVGYLF